MTHVFSVLGLVASAWLVLLQAALALGAPLGAMAWGGQSKGRLPAGKRWASAGSVILMAVFCFAFGQAAGLWENWSDGRLRVAFGIGAVLFAVSFVGNAVSTSKVERLHGVPVSVVMACSCLWLAVFG